MIRRLYSIILAVLLIVTQLPLPVATAADFNSTTYYVKNVTQGGATATTISADPGDEIRLTGQATSGGLSTYTGTRISMPKNANWTYTDYSARWAYDNASFNLNSGAGEVLFSPLYVDSDASGTVTTSDTRVSKYGLNSTSTAPLYVEASTVAGGDDDTTITATLTTTTDVYVSGGDASWASGEFVYIKGSSNVTTTDVEINDIRLASNGSYAAGSIVVSGDTDICSSCLTQATNIKRLGSTTWPFDEGGYPVGDLGVGKLLMLLDTRVTLNSSSANAVSDTLTFSGTGATSAALSSTINVDTTPSVSSVVFTPSSITNDGVSAASVTATTTDKNGVGDISSVTIDLSTIGGSSTAALSNNGDGTWTLAGITTTSSAATYAALTVTATDSTAQTATLAGSLIVQAGGTPTITINSSSDTQETTTDLIIGSTGTATLNWQADEVIYKYELRAGSCVGTLMTGANVALGDGSAQILAGATPVASVLDNANFSAGTTNVYICGTDADSNVGQVFATVTKDLTAATVTIANASPYSLTTGGTSTMTWSANEVGSYSVRVGSCAGSVVSGANASGSYASGSIATVVNEADLSEGSNTMYACITDAGGNTSSDTLALTKDTTAASPVTNVTLVDNDTTQDGVNGYDFTISWTAAATDATFSNYQIYILPSGTTLDTASHAILRQLYDQNTVTWTGDVNYLTDSAGATFAAGNYIAHIVAADNNDLRSSAASSSVAAITLDDTSAPTFSSATTLDTQTIQLTFSEDISFVDTSKITTTGLTIDTAYNTDGYTSGYKISGTDAKKIFLRSSSALATDYTASDLALAACAVRDVTGNLDLNEAGNCAATAAITNANAAVTAQAIADGTSPTLTLTSPAAGGTDNTSIAVDYTLSETAAANSVKLKFTATGGTADANSPHTLLVTDTVIGADAEASGNHTFSLTGSSFTSLERGASDTLVDGTIYTVTLDANDTSANTGATASNTSWTYDTTAPTAPVTTQAFSSPTANTTPVFTWGSVSDAVQYDLQISLNSTSYSPSFVTQTLSPVSVTAASWATTTATFTAASHGLSVGETILISGMTPANYDGSYTVISVPDANSFTVTIGSDPGIFTSGGTAIATSWTKSPAFASDGSADDTYIWRVYATDSAGNQSSASNQQTFILNTQTNTPSIVITDQTNGSATATNSTAVNVALDGYTADVTHYLLSETQSTQPAAGAITTAMPGTAPQTVTYTFSNSTNETKTVYVWVKDGLDNISSNVSSDTIVLDTGVPGTPTLTATDADGGADTGKTNNATISIVVGNDTGVSAWCVASAADGASFTDPTETDCSTGLTGATATSGWVLIEPTSYILGSTGARDLFVWTRDAAGNISAASARTSIDYSTTLPPDPSITLADQTSSSNTYTDSTTINAAIGNDATAFKWIVSTTQASQPSENSVDWSTEPTTVTISIGDGVKTVYVWTKNAYGNISANQVSSSITLDTTAPTVSTRKTQDLDDDGQIDAVQITFDSSIADSTAIRTDWSPSGYTTLSLTGTLGSVSFVNGIATGSSANDSIIYLALTESGSIDTGTTPNLTYTAGSLTDLAGNSLANTGSITTTDGVKPVLIATDPIRVLDVDANGIADSVKIIFSEGLASTTATSPWTLANTPSSGSVNAAALSTTSVANDTITLTLTEGSSGIDTSLGSFTAELSNTSSDITDSSVNAASSFAATSGADYMGPTLVSASYIDTGTVANDSIVISFSEAVNDSTLSVPADFTVVSGGTITNATLNTGSSANDNSITIELNAGDTALTVGTSTIAFSGTAVAADTSTQSNTNTSTATVLVGGGLIINEISWAGSASKTTDEWIELRNISSSAVNFGASTHCLYVGSNKLADLTGTIAGSGLYLVSQFNELSASSALNITPDLTPGVWQTLPDTALQISLYSSADATCNTSDTLLDQADDGAGAPFAGTSGATPATMERNDSIGLGTSSGSWHTAITSTNFDNSSQLGTPKAANVFDASAPTFNTATRFPAHQALMPSDPGSVSIAYSDADTGVDTASVTVEIDLNGDGDYIDANEGTGGYCSGGALIISTTTVECILPAALAVGKHSVRISVSDIAGNTAQTSWDYWIDNYSVLIENRDQANLGGLVVGTGGVSTNDNTTHTKITITTYGAGVTLSGTPSGLMTTGSETIGAHANNQVSAGIGAAYRVKEGLAGIFGNYFNFTDQGTIAVKSQFTGSQLASTNVLQTYTFYIQYFVDASAAQPAGSYTHTIDYAIVASY